MLKSSTMHRDITQGLGGWVMKGWGGVGHVGVGWHRVGHVGVGWIM